MRSRLLLPITVLLSMTGIPAWSINPGSAHGVAALAAPNTLAQGLIFNAPLASDLSVSAGSGSSTFTRGSAGNYLTSAWGVASASSGAARFDYGSALNAISGFLGETAATNLLLHSQVFGDAYWTNIGTTTVADNATTAPDGTTTAAQLTNTATNGSLISGTFTLAANSVFTCSIYVKTSTSLTGTILVRDGASASVGTINYTFGGGTISSITLNVGSSAGSVPLANGWSRVWVTGALGSTANGTARFYVDQTGSSRSLYYWGAQLEAGSAPTAYVATTSSTATRSADVLSYPASGNIDFNNWSISLWVWGNFDGADATNRVLFDTGFSATQDRISISKNGTSLQLKAFGDTASASKTISSTIDGTVWKRSSWNHILATGTKTGPVGLMLNGTGVGAASSSGSWTDLAKLGTSMFFASDLSSANQAGGAMRSPRIWSRILSSNEDVLLAHQGAAY